MSKTNLKVGDVKYSTLWKGVIKSIENGLYAVDVVFENNPEDIQTYYYSASFIESLADSKEEAVNKEFLSKILYIKKDCDEIRDLATDISCRLNSLLDNIK